MAVWPPAHRQGHARACLGSRPMRVLNKPVPRMTGKPRPTTRSSQLQPHKGEGSPPGADAARMHCAHACAAAWLALEWVLRIALQGPITGFCIGSANTFHRVCAPLHLGQPGGLVGPVGGEEVVLPETTARAPATRPSGPQPSQSPAQWPTRQASSAAGIAFSQYLRGLRLAAANRAC